MNLLRTFLPIATLLFSGLLSALFSVPAAAAPYGLIPTESRIGFSVRQMGVPVTGEFKRFSATLDIDFTHPAKSRAELRIAIDSLTTGNDEADEIAMSPDWLDKAGAPYATFRSTAMRSLGGGQYEASGKLSIRNRERDLIVRFGRIEQPGGKTSLTGGFTIRRGDYGIGAGMWNEGGIVAEDIPIEIRLALQPQAPAGRKQAQP